MKTLLLHMENINETFWRIFFSVLTPLPFLQNFPPWKGQILQAKQRMNSLRQFYKETIDEHRATFDPSSQVPRDVIDAFLLGQISSQDQDESLFCEEQLLVILADLFLAGSETTGKSMEWACLFMILHPDVSIKVVQDRENNVLNCGKMGQTGTKLGENGDKEGQSGD